MVNQWVNKKLNPMFLILLFRRIFKNEYENINKTGCGKMVTHLRKGGRRRIYEHEEFPLR